MRKLLLIYLVFASMQTSAQTFSGNGWGVSLGANLSLGTHKNRIGFSAQGYYGYRFFQINAALSGFFSLENWEHKKPSWELQTKTGLVLFSGNPKYERNPYLNITSQQFGKPLSLGYAYIYYWDSQHTSQESGAFGLQIYRFHVVHENDLFGGYGSDRYRTATLSIFYQNQMWKYGLNAILYTGSFNPNDGITHPEGFPSKFGVRSMNSSHLPNASVGVLAGEVQYVLPYGQVIGGQLGIDAEQIRNALQNKFIHDRGFWPNKWVKNGNPHIPMRTVDGQSYYYFENQKIRKPKPYVQFDVNPIGLY